MLKAWDKLFVAPPSGANDACNNRYDIHRHSSCHLINDVFCEKLLYFRKYFCLGWPIQPILKTLFKYCSSFRTISELLLTQKTIYVHPENT